jgi:hypothetical protein
MKPKFDVSPGSTSAQRKEEKSKEEKNKKFCGIRKRATKVEIFIGVLLMNY